MEMQELLQLAVQRNASDLHLSAGSKPILRIDGDLIELENYPVLDADTARRLIYSVMEKQEQEIFESALDVDFAILDPNLAGFRVNVFHHVYGDSAVFRVIQNTIPTLEEINAPEIFRQLLELSSGLILLTGPTGSGKSTTLASMIDYINQRRASHIITIEDPIEYLHKSQKSLIQQRQLYRDTSSFSSALRAALREDPDIILLGEMRDLETIRLALTAAETGHLVLATLHTSSAPRAISRMIDVFPTGEKNIIRNLISQSLQAVICQTLVKKISGGRVAAYEIMLGTPAVRNLIREDKTAQMYTVIQTSSQLGMVTMDQALKTLIDNKITAPDAAELSGFKRELFEKL